MRETSVGAWLAMTFLMAAACSGGQFTSERDAPSGEDSENQKGSGSGDDPAGTPSSSGGRASGGSGNFASGGFVTVGSPPPGGSSSSGGSTTHGGGSGPKPCVEGAVTFRMLPSPDLPHDYLCDAGCGTGWLTVTDPEGATAFPIFSACGIARCDTCELDPCPAAACLPTPLTAKGNDVLWDGSYLARDSCGANMACQRRACVPPGRYKAKACAAVNSGEYGMSGACQPQDEELCAEAEFDFPADGEVELVLEKL